MHAAFIPNFDQFNNWFRLIYVCLRFWEQIYNIMIRFPHWQMTQHFICIRNVYKTLQKFTGVKFTQHEHWLSWRVKKGIVLALRCTFHHLSVIRPTYRH